MRSKSLLSHTTHTVAAVAITVIGRSDASGVEVEVVGEVRIRVRPTRPNEPARPLTVQTAAANATSPHKPQRAREEVSIARAISAVSNAVCVG